MPLCCPDKVPVDCLWGRCLVEGCRQGTRHDEVGRSSSDDHPSTPSFPSLTPTDPHPCLVSTSQSGSYDIPRTFSSLTEGRRTSPSAMTESAAARTYPLRTTAGASHRSLCLHRQRTDHALATSFLSDEPHRELMRQCLDLSLQCEVSQTAFCVGSILVLPPPPLTSTPPTPISASKSLILSTGFSREPPRPNSHAESSAIVKFLGLPPSALADLLSQQEEPWDGWEKWSHEDVLRQADCYTTLEPCSVRTSGQPDCARLLAENQVRRVFVVRCSLSLSLAKMSSDIRLCPDMMTSGCSRAAGLCSVRGHAHLGGG